MTKGLKRIVIAGGAAVGIALLLTAFLLLFPKEEVEPTVSEAPTDAPACYIIKEDGNDLQSMHWKWRSGDELNVEFERTEKGTLKYNVTPESFYFQWNTSKFRSMMFTMSTLTAMGVVEREPKDLSVYGLDDPYFTMTLNFSDKTINLYLGNPTIDKYAYCRTDVDDTVYMVGSYLASLISRQVIEYRRIDSFPVYEEDEIYEKINYVYMELRDGTPVEVTLDSDYSMEGNDALSTYMLLKPVRSSCTDSVVKESVLDVVAGISYTGIYGDITAERLADFGFDKPARVRVQDTEGNVLDLTVGGTDSAKYFCCFTSQYEDFKAGKIDMLTVLEYAVEGFTWIDMDYMTLLNRTVWVQNIHTIESIDYFMNGENYHLALSFEDYVTDAGTDATHVYGNINGKDISETNTKRLYARTLNLREVGTVSQDVELGEAHYSVTLNLKDGSKRELKLYKLNERQYCAVVDESQRFYIYQINIQNLIDAFARLMDDRDLALLYDT